MDLAEKLAVGVSTIWGDAPQFQWTQIRGWFHGAAMAAMVLGQDSSVVEDLYFLRDIAAIYESGELYES